MPGLEGLLGLRVVVGRGSCLWQGFPGLVDLQGMGSSGVVGGQDFCVSRGPLVWCEGWDYHNLLLGLRQERLLCL